MEGKEQEKEAENQAQRAQAEKIAVPTIVGRRFRRNGRRRAGPFAGRKDGLNHDIEIGTGPAQWLAGVLCGGRLNRRGACSGDIRRRIGGRGDFRPGDLLEEGLLRLKRADETAFGRLRRGFGGRVSLRIQHLGE